MSIKYFIKKTTLAGKKFFSAQTSNNATTDKEQIVDLAAKEGGTLTKTDISAVLDLISNVIIAELLRGNRVKLPFVNFGVSIKGKFEGLASSFDSSKHEIKVNATAGSELKKTVADKAVPEKFTPRQQLPVLFSHQDSASNEINETVTGQQISILDGKDLGFNQDQTDEGVFLIDTSDGSAIRANKYVKSLPGQLIYETPVLASGATYKLEIRRRFTTGDVVASSLKDVILTAA